MTIKSKNLTVPNIISFLRLVASPFMILAAWQDHSRIFLTLYICGMLSDYIDGVLARAMHARTRLGALLDSWGDGALYICAAIGGFILWPERILEQAVFFYIAGGMITLSVSACFLKHRKPPSYHTWATKTASAAIGITACLLFMDLAIWPFRAAVILLAVSATESLTITVLLRQWQADIPSVFHAVKLRNRPIPD